MVGSQGTHFSPGSEDVLYWNQQESHRDTLTTLLLIYLPISQGLLTMKQTPKCQWFGAAMIYFFSTAKSKESGEGTASCGTSGMQLLLGYGTSVCKLHGTHGATLCRLGMEGGS
jgi:hypothetical protein